MSGVEPNLVTLEKYLGHTITDASKWHEVLEEIVSIFGGVGGLFLPMIPDGRGAWLVHTKSIKEALEVYIKEGWHQKDYRQNGIKPAISKGYITDYDFISHKEMCDTPYYRDFVFRFNIGFFIGILLDTPNGLWAVSIYFENGRQPITSDEIRTVKIIQTMFRRTIERTAEVADKKLSSFLSLLGEGMTDIHLLDCDGAVVEHYNGAELYSSIIQNSPGSHFSELLNGQHFEQINQICNCGQLDAKGVTFLHTVSDKKLSINIQLVPTSIRHFYSKAKAIAYTTALDSRDIPHSKLRDLFGLTKSEDKTVYFLAEGLRLTEIAQVLGIKESTIRQRLKSIFAKTNVSNQAQLVALFYKV